MAVDELPKHIHPTRLASFSGGTSQNIERQGFEWNDTSGKTSLWGGTNMLAAVGGDAAHNNIQPVKAVYAWLRTA